MATKPDLWDVIDADAVADYLCADHGSWFGVYPDGSYSVGPDVGAEIDPDERPLFRVRCPGIGNVDSTWWAEGVEGAGDMDTEDLIRQGCTEGDVSGEIEDLIRRLEEARAEAGTWCVCGQEPDGPWELATAGLATEEEAREWLRANHGDSPEYASWYIDREDNEGVAESYFDRVEDGLVEHVGCERREFA